MANWDSSLRDKSIAKQKRENFKPLYDRYGADRFARGVNAALHGHHTGFFPTVDEFEAFIPPPGSSLSTCGICEKSIWPGMVLAEALQPKPHLRWTKCDHGIRTDRYEDYSERRTGEQ